MPIIAALSPNKGIKEASAGGLNTRAQKAIKQRTEYMVSLSNAVNIATP
jgi:hypothetical protein